MSKTKHLSQGDLIRECKSVELRLTKNLVEFCLAKFDRGCLLKQVIVDEKQYGSGIMDTLADELDYSAQTLYLEHALAKYFAYDRAKLEKEIAAAQKKGHRVSFEYFRRQLNPASNPEAVGGVENHAKNLTSNIERLAQDVSDAVEIQQRLDPSKAIEVEGATIAGVEVLQEGANWLLGNVTQPGTTKQDKIELPHYLAWVRKQPCVVTGRTSGIEAHHLVLKSRGKASLDIFAVPLSKELHDPNFPQGYHSLGHEKFERKYKVDLRLCALHLIQKYIKEHK